MATIVSIEQVIDGIQASRWCVRKMREVLTRQGQIEPLQVQQYAPGFWITFERDVWGSAIVAAARELGWPTLLIVEMRRYEA